MTDAVRHIAILTRWEWFKLRRRWVPWIVLGFVLVIEELVFWLGATLGTDISYQSTRENIANGIGITSFFAPFIAVIMAATVMGGEYGWGTLRPVLTRGAGRWQFLASKMSLVVIFAIALLIILSIVVTITGIIASFVLTPGPEIEPYGTITWLNLLGFFGRAIYGFVPYVALGLLLVILTTSNGVGTAPSLGYYISETVIIVPILSIFSWSDQVFAFLLSPNVSAWLDVEGGASDSIATFGGMPSLAHAALILTVYTVVLGAGAGALFLRRDVAGAKGG